MKKTVNHRTYDTLKSIRLGSYKKNDVGEILYLTQGGDFFLVGWGDKGSIYETEIDSKTQALGSRIIPISMTNAIVWRLSYIAESDMNQVFAFDYLHIHSRLRRAREKAGMTQKYLARELGVKQYQISLYESGKQALTLHKIMSLCRVLDIELTELFRQINPARLPRSCDEH